MQICAQVSLFLHPHITFFEIVLGPGMVFHAHQLVLILLPGRKQSWKKIRAEFIAQYVYKSHVHIIETKFQHTILFSMK